MENNANRIYQYLKLFIFFLFILSTSKSLAQKDNAEKILGCWILKKIEFTNKDDYSEELIKHAQNSLVCFTFDGKFTTALAKTNEIITGSYKISDDGKIMSQKSDLLDEDFVNIENDAEIEFLDDKQLIIKIKSTTTYFERK
jgi:hypothetical protein